MAMAKKQKRKYEFKPDKKHSDFLNKLYLTQSQQKNLLKWALYALVLLLLSLIQDTMLSKVEFWGATTDLVPCAILLICIIQGTESGSLFVLVASMLFVFSGTAPGNYCIVFLTILGLAAAIFRQAFLRKSFSAAMLCTGVAYFLYEMAVFCMGFAYRLTTFDRLFGFVITAGLTFISAPILYPILISISKIGGEIWKE